MKERPDYMVVFLAATGELNYGHTVARPNDNAVDGELFGRLDELAYHSNAIEQLNYVVKHSVVGRQNTLLELREELLQPVPIVFEAVGAFVCGSALPGCEPGHHEPLRRM